MSGNCHVRAEEKPSNKKKIKVLSLLGKMERQGASLPSNDSLRHEKLGKDRRNV